MMVIMIFSTLITRKECQYGDFDFAGYIPRIGRGNEIY